MSNYKPLEIIRMTPFLLIMAGIDDVKRTCSPGAVLGKLEGQSLMFTISLFDLLAFNYSYFCFCHRRRRLGDSRMSPWKNRYVPCVSLHVFFSWCLLDRLCGMRSWCVMRALVSFALLSQYERQQREKMQLEESRKQAMVAMAMVCVAV